MAHVFFCIPGNTKSDVSLTNSMVCSQAKKQNLTSPAWAGLQAFVYRPDHTICQRRKMIAFFFPVFLSFFYYCN